MPLGPLTRQIEIRVVDPDDDAVQACLATYARFLIDTIEGEGPNPIPLPLSDADDYRPPHGAILVAFSDGMALGCVCLHTLTPGLGEVKRLFVLPEARGKGLARRLMRAIEDVARAMGQSRLNLDTNAALTGAIALYQSDGWQDIPPYTDYPATHWFSKAL